MILKVTPDTMAGKILASAVKLAAKQQQFTPDDLVVAAWKDHPEAFGLRGYDLPHSNRVLSALFGSRGLIHHDYLRKVGDKLELGPAARRQTIEEPAEEADEEECDQVSSLDAVIRMLTSAATHKYRSDRTELRFPDACRFWGISDDMLGPQVFELVDQARKDIRAVARQCRRGPVVMPDGLSVAHKDTIELVAVHTYLEKRFYNGLFILSRKKVKEAVHA